jgi:hypothetical protein
MAAADAFRVFGKRQLHPLNLIGYCCDCLQRPIGSEEVGKGPQHWWLQIPGWLLLTYLVYAQAIPAFDYELGVRMGTQEPAEMITGVEVAFWYGFAFSDLVVYIPLLGAGLIGHWIGRPWWRAILGAALGITVYWPVVVLATAVEARDVSEWDIDETAYWIILPIIAVWALLGLLLVARTPMQAPENSQ